MIFPRSKLKPPLQEIPPEPLLAAELDDGYVPGVFMLES
jgi:hypothetical protein